MFDLTTIAIVLVSILLSMTLHEAMHAYVGYWLGDDTAKQEGRLTLNPFAHIDLFTTILMPLFLVMLGAPPFGAAKPVPFNPNRIKWGEYGAALVGAAGPLTNAALALLGGGVIRAFGEQLPEFWLLAVAMFTLVNLSFFIFNMIPFPPLDGSRVLYAVAPDPVRRVMEQIESMGFAAIIFFFVLFYAVLSDPFSRLLAHLFSLLTGGGQILL
ncbi:MAG TPA: site-2 protease family protein [Candidatus Saccharimonadales bacterium]|nr:site-2 protease family protein [Candidatus Saccharimonadales bacterium]